MRRILKIIMILIVSASLGGLNSGCAAMAAVAVAQPALVLAGTLGAVLLGGAISEGLAEAEKEKPRKLAEKMEKEEKQAARLREEKAIKKEAPVFLADVEDRLKKANWGREALPELLEKTSYLDREFLSLKIRQRLNLAAGLYAYLAGDRQQAKANFRKAKELGVKNPRAIVSEVWTPGSIEAFNAS